MTEATSNPQRIAMCVDDEDHIRSLVRLILRTAGFAVKEARTCAEARQALQSELPTFVVLDINLPDGNGFELAETWRKDGHGALPILFMSGSNPIECQAKVASLKSGFLLKPFNSLDLISAIHSAIQIIE
jgi:DNA-binding response OmpR family regulator